MQQKHKNLHHSFRVRRLLFFLYYWYRNPLGSLTSGFERWLFNKLEGETYEGIKIVDVSLHREVDHAFVSIP